MGMDKAKYPSNWNEISRSIRFDRAKGRCEICGAKHGAEIRRDPRNPSQFIQFDEEMRFWTYNGGTVVVDEAAIYKRIGKWYGVKQVKVVLTVHHIGVPKPDGTPGSPHDKMDCRDENLAALCQRCHLLADLPEHIRKAAVTRANRRSGIAGGQMRLLPE